MINRQSPVPIYYQIEEHIKQLINTSQLKPGDAIPSEREFTEQFEVSRMTVRQAISNLVNEGTLVRLKGKGTFISEQKIEQPLQGLTGFTEEMTSRGLSPDTRLIGFDLIASPKEAALKLGINEHDPIYDIRRVRLADGLPMAVERLQISANLIKGLTEELVNKSLYEYIEKTLQLKIGHANQIIEAVSVKEDEAKYLEVKKGSPILMIERNTFLANGTPLELVKSAYRADRYKFIVDLKR